MFELKLFLPLLAVISIFQLIESDQDKRAQLKKWGMCKGKENLPMKFHDIIRKTTKKNVLYDVKVTVKKEVSTNLTIKFNFWKCDSAGNPDSCEYLIKDFVSNQICEYIGAKDEAWSEFIEHFDKPPTCPIKPGLYVLRDLPNDTEFMKFLPVADALWKVRLEGTDNGKEISCVDIELLTTTVIRRG